MRRRWRIWLGGFLAAVVVAAWLDPTHVLLGLVRNENFFRGRPTSYWRAKVYQRVHPGSDATQRECEPLKLETAFGETPDPAAIPVLVALVDDEDDQVRFFVCNALSAHGSKAVGAVPTLLKMLRHQNVYQRRNAVVTLSHIAPDVRVAIPDLIEALKDDDAWVNYFAALALGRIGGEAREAVPALLELRRSDRAKISYMGEDEKERPLSREMDTVGNAATWALKQIAPELAETLDR